MSQDTPSKPRASLTIAGQSVPLNHFVELALVGVIEGFLGALKGIASGEVVITIPANRRKP